MPAVSKATIEDIRDCGITVRKALYLVEGIWKGLRIFVPHCYRTGMDDALKFLHDSLNELRTPLVDDLGVEPLSEVEMVQIFGGPGGDK